MRPASAADRPAILELFNVVMAHMPRTAEDYAWQYERGPAGPADLRIIECGGRVVSLYVGTRKTLWLRGRKLPCTMVQDVVTHPDFRGRGFLNHLASSFLAEMRLAGLAGLTFPNKMSENSFRRAGWTDLMPIPLRVAATGVPALPGSVLEPVEQFTDETADLWAASGLAIGLLRDLAFLTWRYAKPLAVYRRFWIGGDAGFLVLKVFDGSDRRVVHVCDLVVREEARDLLPAVLAAVHAFAAEKGAVALTCWVPDAHPYATAFSKAGFAPDRTSNRFVFVAGPPDELPQLADAGAWHLSQADNDMY